MSFTTFLSDIKDNTSDDYVTNVTVMLLENKYLDGKAVYFSWNVEGTYNTTSRYK
jgi:hypothetical protein